MEIFLIISLSLLLLISIFCATTLVVIASVIYRISTRVDANFTMLAQEAQRKKSL